MTPGNLIRALETVPEKRLGLFKLVWEVIDENGDLDPDQVIRLAAELEEAFQEARAYTHETERVRWSLRRLMGR